MDKKLKPKIEDEKAIDQNLAELSCPISLRLPLVGQGKVTSRVLVLID